jgi:hypothetical protein
MYRKRSTGRTLQWLGMNMLPTESQWTDFCNMSQGSTGYAMAWNPYNCFQNILYAFCDETLLTFISKHWWLMTSHTHHVMDVWPCSEGTIFWDVMLCSAVKIYCHFRGMSVNFYQATHCDIPKDSTLHSYCHGRTSNQLYIF